MDFPATIFPGCCLSFTIGGEDSDIAEASVGQLLQLCQGLIGVKVGVEFLGRSAGSKLQYGVTAEHDGSDVNADLRTCCRGGTAEDSQFQLSGHGGLQQLQQLICGI